MKRLDRVGIILAIALASSTDASAQISWPLGPQNQVHKIWGTYGQFCGDHFHEGLDLPADSGTAVLAVQNGEIVQLKNIGTPYFRYLSVGIDPNPFPTAWGYLHMNIANHPTQPRSWQVGDAVATGDTLGTITTSAGIMAHLHFEYANDAHPLSWDPTGSTIADYNGNPIEFLNPRADAVAPTVFDPFHYRSQSGEGNAAAVYFTTKTATGDTVIKGNVDVIARAYDRLGNFTGTNYDLNVRKIEFKADQVVGFGVIPYQETEHFSGLFLTADPPVGRNAFSKFRDAPRVARLYEDDNTSNSVPRDLSGATNNAVSYYILTNIDDDFDLELADANRYWDTNGKEGEPWNDNRDDAAHEATDNAEAAFPDGLYTITVRATGQGTASAEANITTVTDTIFVNNHDETIESCDALAATKDTFKVGDPVYVKGSGFPKNRSFNLFRVKNVTWNDGMGLPLDATLITVTADNGGDIPPTQVWDSYAPNGSPDQGYDLIVDYESDLHYTAAKEGHTVDVLDDNDVGPAGFIGKEGVDVSFIIDDTRSMGEEIDGVRNALLAHLATYTDTVTVFQLVTFKDNVSPRAPTRNLGEIQAQVDSLTALGGGDCPEASVEAINLIKDDIVDNGRAFIATDADPHPEQDVGAAIADLRSRGIRVDIVLSGVCGPGVASLEGCGSHNDCQGGSVESEILKVKTRRLSQSDIIHATTSGDTLSLGDDDFQEVMLPFAFPFGARDYMTAFVGSNGYITFGEGDTDRSESSFDLVSGPRRIAGLWDDLNPSVGGVISAGVVGSEFHVIFDNVPEFGSSNSVSFTIQLRANGTFAVVYGASTILDGLAGFSVGNRVVDPGEIDLSMAPQPIQSTANGTAYERFGGMDNDLMNLTLEYAAVTFDPPVIYNAIEAFSLMARETGGIFSYIPEVNTGNPSDIQRFENAIFNVVQGGINQSVALAQPPLGPAGGSLNVTIIGSGTNFQFGTNLVFDGGGISVSNVNVISPIQLEATITIDAGASVGFRDVTTITNLGGGVIDTARGVGVFEVVAAPPGPRVLGITPPSGEAGQTISATVYGINTQFSNSSVLDVGSGITVSNVSAASPQILQATLNISTSADVGFRDVTVRTGPEFAFETMTGPFFVSLASPAAPRIASISPSSGAPGDSLTVMITGQNTAFVDGVSTLSFSGSGISVTTTTVIDSSTLTAFIQIDSTATPGLRDVRVTTGSEVAVLLSGFSISELGVSVPEPDAGTVPGEFTLAENYPNPFNPMTQIMYGLPQQSRVRLTIYNVVGQEVAALIDGVQASGFHEITWNGTNATGIPVASGLYFYRLEATGGDGTHFSNIKKMLMLK